MKRFVSVAIVISIIITIFPLNVFAAYQNASSWAIPELNKAESYGLIPEIIKSNMKQAITREEFSMVCVRVYENTSGQTAPAAPTSTFTDTKSTDVLKAYQLGIIKGVGNGTFAPRQYTDREQIATMIKRLIFALTPAMHVTSTSKTSYTDNSSISSWATESVAFSTKFNFVKGSNNQFSPKDTCTREMAVLIGTRVYEFYKPSETLENDSPTKSEILTLAKNYFQETVNLVEVTEQFRSVINFIPDFTGKTIDIDKAKKLSGDAAQLITYTSAKNMYLAFASAVFTLDPDSSVAATNFGTAIATYNDELIKSNNSSEEYYDNAIKVYNYALIKSMQGGKYTNDSLSILVNMGNLYLDANNFKQAYAAFNTAYTFNKNCSGARIGLMNYYLAKGDLQNALKYVNGVGYPAIAQKVADIEKEKPAVMGEDIPGYNSSEAELVDAIQKDTEIPVITTFDYLQNIDPKAHDDAKDFIDNIKSKMKFVAPSINIVSQYSSLENISKPMGQSALESFAFGVEEFETKHSAYETAVKFDYLERMGAHVDLGGIPLWNYIQNPTAYKDIDPVITGEDNIEISAEEMMNNLQSGLKNIYSPDGMDIAESDKLLSSLSKSQPEMAIFTKNPFEFGNYLDFFVQRYNVLALTRKMNVLPSYAMKINQQVTNILNEESEKLGTQIDKLNEAQQKEEDDLTERLADSDLSILERTRLFHGIHEKYRPQRNSLKNVAFNKVTSEATKAYLQKIKPNAEKVYNDCMGHIMLISDEKVQKNLENRLNSQILLAVSTALSNVLTAYNIAEWEEESSCGCNLEQLEAEEKQRQEEEEAAAKDQALNDEEARKKFEAGEISENSELYKKYIKPYEVNINTIVFQGKVGPYKTGWNVTLGLEPEGLGGGINFGKMQNLYRNTTTYDGGLTLTAKAAAGDNYEGKLSVNLGASLTKDANGNFSPNDVDIVADATASARVGITSASIGVEASASRGTRFHSKGVITGDKYIDKYKQDVMGHWPDIELKVWDGQY
ncbi:MAG: S-layer homology domain-containing protein [Bacteroidota bacterium]|nr:S-layer homology domain-containing protein [Bacteroidota bacterium]